MATSGISGHQKVSILTPQVLVCLLEERTEVVSGNLSDLLQSNRLGQSGLIYH